MKDLYRVCPALRKVVKETGYKTLRSLSLLYWLAQSLEPSNILELGTGYGCSAICMALGSFKSKVITVDDYKHDEKFTSMEKVKLNTISCGVHSQVKVIEGDTREAVSTYGIEDDSVEMVFMDASHNMQDLSLEYEACRQSLKTDHIIVVDDYNSVYIPEGSTPEEAEKNSPACFVSSLVGNYEVCTILYFHNGVAVLSTNLDKYSAGINNAIWRANHA